MTLFNALFSLPEARFWGLYAYFMGKSGMGARA